MFHMSIFQIAFEILSDSVHLITKLCLARAKDTMFWAGKTIRLPFSNISKSHPIYSGDLVTRGGKFNLLWLLATKKDRNEVIKSKRKQLMKLNLSNICKELERMFPARGKTNSLSLRTSAMLVMGTCITIRLRAQELRRDVVNLLSLKVTGKFICLLCSDLCFNSFCI